MGIALRMLAVLWLCPPALAQTFTFESPSEDRWHYPFNFQGGNEATASCFGALGAALEGAPFNDRDGMMVQAWDTSAEIAPGQGPDAYIVTRVTLHMSNIASAEWLIDLTPDEWFTYDINIDGAVNADGIPRGEPGDVDGESDDDDPGRPIELFGVGFGPTYTPSTWTEHSLYEGPTCAAPPDIDCLDEPRDPFPLTFRPNGDGTADVLHVEDNVKGLHNDELVPPVFEFTPQPWAIGVPQGYVPGAQTVPFEITFELDLCVADDFVRKYIQEALDRGRVELMITALTEAAIGGSDVGFPKFFTKEAVGQPAFPGATAGRLDIELGPALDDCDDDGIPDACAFAAGAGDCNGNGIPDACDIADRTSTDDDLDGIPDECACLAVADCCDLDDNAVRDDGCMWCECTAGACQVLDLAPTFADMGGAFGACPPDGFANIHDRNHALTCFAGQNSCEPLNLDAGGAFGACPPDGFCNIHDANHALAAFGGANTCTCPGGPTPVMPPPAIGEATIRLRSTPRNPRPGAVVTVEAVLETSSSTLTGYQLHLGTSGGEQGRLTVLSATSSARAWGGQPHYSANNVMTGQVLSGLDELAAVAVPAGTVLAAYEVQVSNSAQGTFVIDALHDDAVGDQTFLIGPDLGRIGIHTIPAVITVRKGARR